MTRAQLDANHLDAQSAFVNEFLEGYNDPQWNPSKNLIPALLWPYFEKTDTRLREAGGKVEPANGMLLVFCVSIDRECVPGYTLAVVMLGWRAKMTLGRAHLTRSGNEPLYENQIVAVLHYYLVFS
jgi:hypothetical protein